MTDTAKVGTASAYRQRRNQGTEWTAPSGSVVLVRDLDISDHAVANKLPDAIRKRVFASIEQSASLRTGKTDDGEDSSFFAGLSGEELLKMERDAGIALCKLGWVNPQVVDTIEDDDTQISVDELDPRDRRAYLNRVFGVQQQEAERLAPFPGRQDGNVGTGHDGATVQPASKQPAEVASVGILQRDSI